MSIKAKVSLFRYFISMINVQTQDGDGQEAGMLRFMGVTRSQTQMSKVNWTEILF